MPNCGRNSKASGSATAYEQAIAFLDDRVGQGVKPGLERISGLLDLLAGPHTGYPIIHIAGTNGKGSTARIAAALLSAHGLTPGLFTSPHLHHIEERYEVGGVLMTPGEFADAVAEIAPIVELYEDRAGEGVTYFELTTALAFSWFAERAVDVAVVETGLGGRWDASNAADGTVAVVTTIGLEHTEYLGETIAEIAAEKLAILPEAGVLVTGNLGDEATAVAERVVEQQGASWMRMGTELRVVEAEIDDGGWLVTIDGIYATYPEIRLALHGRHQVDNLVVAIGAVESLFGRELDAGAVAEAAATVTSPGRMEVISRDPIVLIDGAHNPPGMAALTSALREEFPGLRWQIVFGAMSDKDVRAMLEMLRPFVSGCHAVAADSTRAMPAGDLAELAADVFGGEVPVTTHDSVAAGVVAAAATGESVMATGSIYVVGEARIGLGLA